MKIWPYFLVIIAAVIFSVWLSSPIESIVEVKKYTENGTLVILNKSEEIIIRNYPNKLEEGMELKISENKFKPFADSRDEFIIDIIEGYEYFGDSYRYKNAEYKNFKDLKGENVLVLFKKDNYEKYYKSYYGKITDLNYDTVTFEDESSLSYEDLQFVISNKDN